MYIVTSSVDDVPGFDRGTSSLCKQYQFSNANNPQVILLSSKGRFSKRQFTLGVNLRLFTSQTTYPSHRSITQVNYLLARSKARTNIHLQPKLTSHSASPYKETASKGGPIPHSSIMRSPRWIFQHADRALRWAGTGENQGRNNPHGKARNVCLWGGGPLLLMIPYLMPLPSRCSWRVLHAPPAPCSHMGVARRGRGWVLISCGLDLCDDVKKCFRRDIIVMMSCFHPARGFVALHDFYAVVIKPSISHIHICTPYDME